MPPERTLGWVVEAVGGGRVTALRRLGPGNWHVNHALTVKGPSGAVHRLVLRRWARPGWDREDPDFTVEREAVVLELLSGSSVPVPEVVAADPTGESCDVPSLLLTRLRGRPPALPADASYFLRQLAETLVVIHSVPGARQRIPAFRRYYDPSSLKPPGWAQRRDIWERALAVAASPPPGAQHFLIHRDYHPENTLWARGRLTGVVDWTSASWGPIGADTGHMRWNLAVTYGLDAADEFLAAYRSASGRELPDQPYWDVATLADVLPEVREEDWPGFDLDRIQRYAESAVASL
jgi:aminoglycoside phosphotransferase (APT) family kinase protein